jgi:hypothetical protein
MRLFMSFRLTHTTALAAAKAGFSTAIGYRIENEPRLPSHEGDAGSGIPIRSRALMRPVFIIGLDPAM